MPWTDSPLHPKMEFSSWNAAGRAEALARVWSGDQDSPSWAAAIWKGHGKEIGKLLQGKISSSFVREA